LKVSSRKYRAPTPATFDLRPSRPGAASARPPHADFGRDTPAERDYGFRGQIQAAGISIMNNIAEGFERTTDADKARFLDIAKGSCGEVRSMYYVA